MRPTPIPEEEIWAVEALLDHSPSTGARCLSVRCELEDGDLAKLAAGGRVWITFYGAMVPWAITIVENT